jgi:aspartate 1-decarboxylase
MLGLDSSLPLREHVVTQAAMSSSGSLNLDMVILVGHDLQEGAKNKIWKKNTRK